MISLFLGLHHRIALNDYRRQLWPDECFAYAREARSKLAFTCKAPMMRDAFRGCFGRRREAIPYNLINDIQEENES